MEAALVVVVLLVGSALVGGCYDVAGTDHGLFVRVNRITGEVCVWDTMDVLDGAPAPSCVR